MRRKCSIVLGFTLAITLFTGISIPNPVQATDSQLEDTLLMMGAGEWVLKVSGDGSQYIRNNETGYKITEAWRYDDSGNLLSVSLSDYATELNHAIQLQETLTERRESDVSPNSIDGYSDTYIYQQTYNQNSTGSILGKAEKITPDFVGPVTVSIDESVQVKSSIQVKGFQSYDESVIKKEANFKWRNSTYDNKPLSISVTIPDEKTGCILFTPVNNYTEGVLQVKTYNEANHLLSDKDYPVFAQSPRQLNSGYTDGIYSVLCK